MPPHLKFTYFNIPARAEPIRLALTIGRVPFEDVRIKGADWPKVKPTIPLQAVPLLEVDGEPLSQAMTILRYVGRLTSLYPVEDPWKAALVDEVLDTTTDITTAVNRYTGPPGEEKAAFRERFARESIPRYWGGLEERVKAIVEKGGGDGPFVLGSQVSVADLAIAVIYNLFVVCKFFDGVPGESFAPYTRLKAVRDAVMEIPEVQEWYKKHPLV